MMLFTLLIFRSVNPKKEIVARSILWSTSDESITFLICLTYPKRTSSKKINRYFNIHFIVYDLQKVVFFLKKKINIHRRIQ